MPICHMQLVRTQAAVLGRERAARALTKRPAAVLPGPHARGGGAPRLKVGVVAHVARRLRPAAQRRQASGSKRRAPRYPCSAPYTRPGRAHLPHQSRTRTTADAARELGFAHFRDGVRGEPDGDREAQRARVEHICRTHTHAQACDRSGCELAKQGRHIECGCEGGRVDGAAREHVSTGARTWRDCTPRSGSR